MPSLSRRRFFGLVASAAVAAPVAIAAAPALIDELAALQAPYIKPAYDVVGLTFHRNAFAMVWPKIGDTIMIKKPIRFKPIASYEFTWSRDEILAMSTATPEDLALFHRHERKRAGLDF